MRGLSLSRPWAWLVVVGCLGHPAAGQATWQARHAEVADLEMVSDPLLPVAVELREDRRFQEYVLPLADLAGRLDALAGGEAGALEGVDPLRLRLTVEFFGLYRTSGGTWGIKFLGELSDPLERSGPTQLSADDLLGRSEPRGSVLARASEAVMDEIMAMVEEAAAVAAAQGAGGLRQVLAFGRAPIEGGDTAAALGEATMDGLARAVALALGTFVERRTEVEDFGSASSVTRSEEQGRIATHRVLDEHTRFTDDGYVTVVVEALVAGSPRGGSLDLQED